MSILNFNVSDDWLLLNNETPPPDFYAEQVIAISRNPRVANVTSITLNGSSSYSNRANFVALEEFENVSLNVHIHGHSLGKTIIDILVVGHTLGNFTETPHTLLGDWHPRRSSKHMETLTLASFDVAVVRRTLYKRLGLAFTIIIATLTICTTFLLGTKLDWRIVLKEIKRPSSLLIGLGLEFSIMPLVSKNDL